MRKNDIVLARFPFSSLDTQKLRPVLVLAAPSPRTIIAAKISSAQRDQPFEIAIGSNNALMHSSFIHMDMLFTLERSLVTRRLGKLPEKLRKEVDRKLQRLFRIQNHV